MSDLANLCRTSPDGRIAAAREPAPDEKAPEWLEQLRSDGWGYNDTEFQVLHQERVCARDRRIWGARLALAKTAGGRTAKYNYF